MQKRFRSLLLWATKEKLCLFVCTIYVAAGFPTRKMEKTGKKEAEVLNNKEEVNVMKEMDEKREIGKAEEAKSKKGEKEGEEEMNQEENQNSDDDGQSLVSKPSSRFLASTKRVPLPNIGRRMWKRWYRVTPQGMYNHHNLTIVPISSMFPCEILIERYLNQRVSDFQHPHVQTINEIKLLTRKGSKHAAIIQPSWERGSLKDYIYNVSPFQDWSKKYNKNRVTGGLSAKKVALFGGQILEAVVYLYGRGLSPLGHLQTGNIYMESEDTCRVGGYENTLLKLRSRIHRTCADFKYLDSIDIIMFGHVIYEMCTGHELTRLVPSEQDYSCVEEHDCREVLTYIFAMRNGRFQRGIIKIQTHWFFGGIFPCAPPSPIVRQKDPILEGCDIITEDEKNNVVSSTTSNSVASTNYSS